MNLVYYDLYQSKRLEESITGERLGPSQGRAWKRASQWSLPGSAMAEPRCEQPQGGAPALSQPQASCPHLTFLAFLCPCHTLAALLHTDGFLCSLQQAPGAARRGTSDLETGILP